LRESCRRIRASRYARHGTEKEAISRPLPDSAALEP
jgi:hypothetical protein